MTRIHTKIACLKVSFLINRLKFFTSLDRKMTIVLFTRKAELQAIFFSFDCSQRCFNILARNNRLANYHFYFSILTEEKYCCSLHTQNF